MAIVIGEPQTVTKTTVERTCRVMILCNAHDPVTEWRVEFLRGKIVQDSDSNSIGPEDQTAGQVNRKFGEIAAAELPGGPRNVSNYTDLMHLIADCGDALRQQDLAAAEAARLAVEAAEAQEE